MPVALARLTHRVQNGQPGCGARFAVFYGLLAASALFAQRQPFNVETLLKIARISDPALSPNGRLVAFTVQSPDLDKNAKPEQIYVVPIDGLAAPRQLTQEGSVNERPRWSPDSRQIYFTSNRGGSQQIWVMDADGSHARQITHIATEASGETISADGRKLVFLSSVYPDCGADNACNQLRLDQDAKNPIKARIYTSLLFRHWNEWEGKRRQHILSMNVDGTSLTDLTPGERDVPPFSLGGPDDYAISPDSMELAYVTNTDPELATSTNSDIYTVPIEGGDSKRVTTNPGADESPQYSPDGKMLAYRSQVRAGYESDRWRLMVIDRATMRPTNLTEGLDRWVESFTWAPDSTRLFFTVEDRGRTGVQMVQATGGGSRNVISGSSSLDDLQFTSDGRTMIYSAESGSSPSEIFRVNSSGGNPYALTHLNDSLLSRYQLTPLEEMSVEGADRTRVSAFIVKPPGFDESQKYPVLFLIHGGPQGAWGETWTYRWNAQVFAGAGYVVVMPNPRGSTGYGQKFIDDINGDWGGRAYDDIMAVVDTVSQYKYVDSSRLAAAGGSYGGYMVNWILGHTNQFKALVSHDGVFDLRSMAASTEELWFPMWEFKGMPWDNPDMYSKWSPSYFVKDFKTPTLVIHGEEDYRVPFSQGLQLFTALQIQKVPSKLLEFPDEGHWVLKPADSALWYHTVLDWVFDWINK